MSIDWHHCLKLLINTLAHNDFGFDLYVECFEYYGIVLARIGMYIAFDWLYT
jgi:hypothetical protein